MANLNEPLVHGTGSAPCVQPYNTRPYTGSLVTAAATGLGPLVDGASLVRCFDKWLLIGGWSTSPEDWGDGVPVNTTNRVLSSTDLETWTQELAHAPAAPTSGAGARFLPRHTFMVWVTDEDGPAETLWVAGSDQYAGPPSTAIPSDIWYSTNGTTWTRAAASSPWGALGRSGSDMGIGGVWNPIVGILGDYVHVMGGHRHTSLATAVEDWAATREHWRAPAADPTSWTQLADMPFDRAGVLKAPALCGKLFVIGGNSGTNTTRVQPTDCWALDGSSWLRMSGNSRGVWSGRDYIATPAFDDKLWVLTGYNDPAGNQGGAYWSRDLGRTWERAFAAPWAGSHADGFAVGGGRIAIVSGNGHGNDTYEIEVAP